MFIFDALFVAWFIRRFLRKNNLTVALQAAPPAPELPGPAYAPTLQNRAGEPAQTLPQRLPEPRTAPIPDTLGSLLAPVPAGRHEAPDWLQDDDGARIRAAWAQKAWDGLGTCQHPADVPCHASRSLTALAFA